MSIIITDIPDDDYFLVDEAGWFRVNGFAIRIHATDEGVAVAIYKDGAEDKDPLASCRALDDDLRKSAKSADT